MPIRREADPDRSAQLPARARCRGGRWSHLSELEPLLRYRPGWNFGLKSLVGQLEMKLEEAWLATGLESAAELPVGPQSDRLTQPS